MSDFPMRLKDLRTVLMKVGLSASILDQEVGTGGSLLSVGERQVEPYADRVTSYRLSALVIPLLFCASSWPSPECFLNLIVASISWYFFEVRFLRASRHNQLLSCRMSRRHTLIPLRMEPCSESFDKN
jgi:hypothetical protein